MILDFIDAIRSGQPPRTDGAAGLRVQQRGEGGSSPLPHGSQAQSPYDDLAAIASIRPIRRLTSIAMAIPSS